MLLKMLFQENQVMIYENTQRNQLCKGINSPFQITEETLLTGCRDISAHRQP